MDDNGAIQEKQCLDHGEVVDKLAQRQQGACANDRVFHKDDGNASLALQGCAGREGCSGLRRGIRGRQNHAIQKVGHAGT